METASRKIWGPFGLLAVLIGFASWFVGGMLAIAVGLAAVAAGFFGMRKGHRLSQAGMILGVISMLFFNIVNLGALPVSAPLESDKSHLIKSIYASIDAFDVLSKKNLTDADRASLIGHYRRALKEAEMVNLAEVDKQVPGFSSHYGSEFIKGTELLIEGYETGDISKKLKGGLLMDQWGLWNRENKARLEQIKEPSPSLAAYLKGIVAS